MLSYLRRYAASVCLAGILVLQASSPFARDNKEYLVKAAFIYNFIKFVEWPGGKAVGKQSAIDVCVIGDSDMLKTSEVFERASTSKLAISLVRETSGDNAVSHCHIVFIGDSEEKKLSQLLSVFKEKPLLTVSDINNFSTRGGMIEFTTVDNKVKLIVNTGTAAASGLRIDAQLLEVALKVIHR